MDKKKLLIINSVCGSGSTGRICDAIIHEYEGFGYDVKMAFGRGNSASSKYPGNTIRIGNELSVLSHVLSTRMLDDHGLKSRIATGRFLKWADKYDPDMLWIHNIHGYYINYEMLFDWIKARPNMSVKWTLHDCWAFTGHCAYFDYAGCDKWKAGCEKCPQKKEYPSSVVRDGSRENYLRKKAAFLGVKDMQLIVPSEWMKNGIKESFLACYPVEVRHNTIDTCVFKPVEGSFREENLLLDQKIVLGVANKWEKRKGLEDFAELTRRLCELCGEDTFKVVLVGVSDKQKALLPKNTISIRHTESAEKLAEIYSAADVFFNPTHEDNYPTVNLEAEACGTPVVTYDTGGCRETIRMSSSCTVRDLDEAVNVISKMILS